MAVLGENSLLPEGPSYLMNYYQSDLILTINYAVLSTPICLFGIVVNAINIIVFCKQGFAYSMNISLCALAVSDLCCLVIQLWMNVCFSPLLRRSDISFVPEEIQYLTASVPEGCFSRINTWITVFITAERCLGIARPLKVKEIITPHRSKIIMCVIYLFSILAVSIEFNSYHHVWRFSPEQNRTRYGIITNMSITYGRALPYAIYILTGSVSFIALIIFTVILVAKLNKKSAWRKRATDEKSNSNMLTRDRKTVKMVTLLATVTIVCYTPLSIIALVMACEPQFRVLGTYKNTYFVMLSYGFLFQTLNSSVNICLYYKMSSKYRQTFQELFPYCRAEQNKDHC